jgi:hypothetical protein
MQRASGRSGGRSREGRGAAAAGASEATGGTAFGGLGFGAFDITGIYLARYTPSKEKDTHEGTALQRAP